MPGLREELLDRRERADAHERGVDADGHEGAEVAEALEAERLRLLAAHDERSGRAVGERRAVAGRDRALRRERRLQRREALGRRVGARQLVDLEVERLLLVADVADALDRDDLLLEDLLLDRRRGLLLAVERERVLLLARDAELRGDVLRRDAHRRVDRGHLLHRLGRHAELVAGHRHHAHRLDTAGDDDVARAEAICPAAMAMAWRPLEQKRLIVCALVSTGRPPSTPATRAMLSPCSPSGIAQPRTRSSTSLGFTCGTRASRPRITSPASSSGRLLASEPLMCTTDRAANRFDDDDVFHDFLVSA